MKPRNTWVASIGCAGLCLALVGCGGSNVPDPESDAHAATTAPPPAAPAAPAPVPEVARNTPEAAPAPAPAAAPVPEPAPTPAPAAAAAAPATPTPAPAPGSEPTPAAPKTEVPASKPAEVVAKAEPAAPAPGPAPGPVGTPATPASPEAKAPAPAAASGPVPAPAQAPAADAAAKVENNPFAVFSEAQAPPRPAPAATPPAAGPAPESPPQEAPPAEPNAPADPGGGEDGLGFLAAAVANRGPSKYFHDPITAANFFLDAIKKKDLNAVAQATALHAATESKNTKLWQLILSQELAQEDLDELAKKLDKYQMVSSNVPKSSGKFGVIIRKPEGTSMMQRTITMRHEKAGWKVQDISGEGEIEKPIITPRMRGPMGRGRR